MDYHGWQKLNGHMARALFDGHEVTVLRAPIWQCCWDFYLLTPIWIATRMHDENGVPLRVKVEDEHLAAVRTKFQRNTISASERDGVAGLERGPTEAYFTRNSHDLERQWRILCPRCHFWAFVLVTIVTDKILEPCCCIGLRTDCANCIACAIFTPLACSRDAITTSTSIEVAIIATRPCGQHATYLAL